ncbi:MAG: hypothetical protein DRH12_08230 [Deltaproteobacteria bacterium]|nr:MAG: hypothetical protein DRH12_08230 [Deltaproteobacteria bacterium]
MPQKDYYKILGVSRETDSKEIRNAYRRLAKKYHPDKAGPEAKDQFQDVQEAYEVLSDPEKRSSYDRMLWEEEHGIRIHRRPPIYDSGPWRGRRFCRFSRRNNLASRIRPDLILILSTYEAEEGGSVEIEIPYYTSCPYCGGDGQAWFFPCPHCLGEGVVVQRKRMEISIPAGVRDGTVLEIPLQIIRGIRRFLTVLIEIK